MYRLVQGTMKRGFAQGYGLTGAGVHEEVSVPIVEGQPVDTRGVPLESDRTFITLGSTRCESFLGGTLFVAIE